TLSVMFVDRTVDEYDSPHPNLCGDCDLCLRGCPTAALPEPGVVDARRCLSYQTIENRGPVPEPLRPKLAGHLFGCDVCEEVCPLDRHDGDPGRVPKPPRDGPRRAQPDAPHAGDARFAPRPLGVMPPEQVAALTRGEFDQLSAGMALARAQYDG